MQGRKRNQQEKVRLKREEENVREAKKKGLKKRGSKTITK